MELPGGITPDIRRNVLYVKGTDQNDKVQITQNDHDLEIKINDQIERVPSENIKIIDVKLMGGNDQFEFKDNRSGSSIKSIKLHLDGGDGNDNISGSPTGDLLSGGKGNDVIHGRGGDDEIYGDEGFNKIFGDEGDDFLMGNTGTGNIKNSIKNVLIGGPGEDYTNKGFWRGNQEITEKDDKRNRFRAK